MNASDVGRIADLEKSTVIEWTDRGVLTAQADGSYAVIDALRFAAVGSLVKAGVPVYRAAEAIGRVEGDQRFWLDAGTPQEHLWIYAITFGSQVFRAVHFAGDSAAADREIQERFGNPSDSGSDVIQNIGDGEIEYEYPQAPGAPLFRIVRYDIGADLGLALREIAKYAGRTGSK
jgi:hypothetical protein